MTGATIDHLISIMVFLAAILLFISLFNGNINAAITYQRHRQIVMKANDLIDSICLSNFPAFGLADPDGEPYSLSPTSLLKLLSSDQLVYYNRTGMWFSNISLSQGASLLVPLNECINYTTAAKLLGVNGTYGFQLKVVPTLNVSISENNTNPLRLRVEVTGLGSPLSNATLNYYLYRIYKSDNDSVSIEPIHNTTQTNSLGVAMLNFTSVNALNDSYVIIMHAHLSGLLGVGYYSHEHMTEDGERIIPFIESFEEGRILLAHSWDLNPPPGEEASALHYNATFLMLTQNLELRSVDIPNSTGLVNYAGKGKGQAYNTTQVPPSDAGILVIAYRKGNEHGVTVMPWGINSLGVSIAFGDDPSRREWVATEVRQVTIGKMSYQVMLAVWKY
jgi:hypothetical protein